MFYTIQLLQLHTKASRISEIHMEILEKTQKRLESHVQSILSSEFYASSLKLLQPLPFKRIRCIALGSPTQEFQALYQLAYLKLLAKEFDLIPEHVSLYDPVFTGDDIHLLESFNYVVEESEDTSPQYTSETLYYMPHAPRSVTDHFLATVKPSWILGNDVRVTMGSLSKSKFFLEYPRLAKLVHIAELQGLLLKDDLNIKLPQLNSLDLQLKSLDLHQSEFTVVTRRKRNRSKKNIYVEPKLDYDLIEVYFDKISVVRIESPPSAPWNDSFSDLALNTINHMQHG